MMYRKIQYTTFETRLPSNLRPTTGECVHLVTRAHFRSRDKDDGHTIRSAISKKVKVNVDLYSASS